MSSESPQSPKPSRTSAETSSQEHLIRAKALGEFFVSYPQRYNWTGCLFFSRGDERHLESALRRECDLGCL